MLLHIKSLIRLLLVAAIFIFVIVGCKKEDPWSSYVPTETGVNVIYDPQDPVYTKKVWQGIPTIEVLPNNEIWAAWYSGGSGEAVGNYVVVARSKDMGLTWKKNVTVIQPNKDYRVFDPCLWYDKRSKRLHLFWAQTYRKAWDGLGGVWDIQKTEEGTTWSAPERLTNGVMINKPLLIGQEAVYPVAYWNSIYAFLPIPKFPEEAGTNIFMEHASLLTFKGRIPINKVDEEIPEHQVVKLNDGRLWTLLRGMKGIYESYSSDSGRTWSDAILFTRCGPTACSRFHIQRLKSGRLILVMNAGKQRTNLSAFLSSDDGKTWPNRILIDERKDVSYPDASEDKKGTVYITYDRERYNAKEILLVKLTEKMIIDSTHVRNPQIKKILIDN